MKSSSEGRNLFIRKRKEGGQVGEENQIEQTYRKKSGKIFLKRLLVAYLLFSKFFFLFIK